MTPRSIATMPSATTINVSNVPELHPSKLVHLSAIEESLDSEPADLITQCTEHLAYTVLRPKPAFHYESRPSLLIAFKPAFVDLRRGAQPQVGKFEGISVMAIPETVAAQGLQRIVG